MSKSMKQELVPELRFPEFRDKGAWRSVRLGQLGELVSGLTYSPDDVQEKGLLVLRSSNVQNGDISLEDKVYVRSDIKGANLSKPDDILICVRNGSKPLIGKNALIPKGMPLSTHGAFMTVFRSPSAKFVYQLFQTSAYERQVAADLGATINSINGNQFKKYEFYIPELEKEQQKIADCLSSLDELITTHIQKHKALQSYKKGLMQNLFPNEGETVPAFRFPEFEAAGDWVVEKFGDITNFNSGGTPSKDRAEYWDGDIPWISAASMHDISIEDSDRYITKLAVEDGARLASKGTLLLLVRGSMLHKRIPVGIAECEVAFNQDVKALRLKKPIFERFLLYFLISSEQRLLGAVTKTGIGAGKLDTNDLKDFKVSIPKNTDEQQKIAECLSSVDDLITAQAQKIEDLKAHKKGLMQQLFPKIDGE